MSRWLGDTCLLLCNLAIHRLNLRGEVGLPSKCPLLLGRFQLAQEWTIPRTAIKPRRPRKQSNIVAGSGVICVPFAFVKPETWSKGIAVSWVAEPVVGSNWKKAEVEPPKLEREAKRLPLEPKLRPPNP